MSHYIEKIVPKLNKLSNHPIIQALSDGFVSILPIMLIGAVAQILKSILQIITLINGSTFQFINQLDIINNFSFGLLGIILAIAISYSIAKRRNINTLITSAISLCAYLLLAKPIIASGEGGTTFTVLFDRLSTTGMIVSMISGMFTGFLVAIVYEKCSKFKENTQLPEFIIEWFIYALSGLLIIVLCWLITYQFDFDFFVFIANITTPLTSLLNSYLGLAIIGFLVGFCWLVGIKPASILSGIVPIMMASTMVNADLFAQGVAPSVANGYQVFNAGYWLAFVAIGGVGSTFAINILMVISKSRSLKSIGKICMTTSIFGINEPLVFGLPLAFNFTLGVPLIISNIVNAVLGKLFTDIGVFTPGYIPSLVGFLPPGFGAFLTNESIMTFVVVIIIILIDIAIYYPFFKGYEKQKISEEV